MNIGIKEAAAFLKENDNYLIYTHASPDADTIGSGCALALILRSMGKQASALCTDRIPSKLDFLPTNGVFLPKIPHDLCVFTPISVDVASAKMIPALTLPEFELSLDHHKVNTVFCKRLCNMSDFIAVGELIFLLMKELGAELTKEIALCLYAAICSDSGGFRYDATSPQTHRIAAELLEKGIDHAYVCRRLFESKTKEQIALEALAYSKLEITCNGRFAFVAVTPEEFEATGAEENEFEALNNIPRQVAGVSASAVIRRKNGKTKVSLRSNDMIDMSEIAQRFGGGGHFHAAGFSSEDDLDSTVSAVKAVFEEMWG